MQPDQKINKICYCMQLESKKLTIKQLLCGTQLYPRKLKGELLLYET